MKRTRSGGCYSYFFQIVLLNDAISLCRLLWQFDERTLLTKRALKVCGAYIAWLYPFLRCDCRSDTGSVSRDTARCSYADRSKRVAINRYTASGGQ